uniref:Uncharacterized protein n=1 Tax=Oryza barthii TaxID=65489 RepID=A0A0D3EP04_9ORYZ
MVLGEEAELDWRSAFTLPTPPPTPPAPRFPAAASASSSVAWPECTWMIAGKDNNYE